LTSLKWCSYDCSNSLPPARRRPIEPGGLLIRLYSISFIVLIVVLRVPSLELEN
jgi:hypothetical protein